MDGCLSVPEDGEILAGEMDNGVVTCFPELKLGLSTHDGGGALKGKQTFLTQWEKDECVDRL